MMSAIITLLSMIIASIMYAVVGWYWFSKASRYVLNELSKYNAVLHKRSYEHISEHEDTMDICFMTSMGLFTGGLWIWIRWLQVQVKKWQVMRIHPDAYLDHILFDTKATGKDQGQVAGGTVMLECIVPGVSVGEQPWYIDYCTDGSGEVGYGLGMDEEIEEITSLLKRLRVTERYIGP